MTKQETREKEILNFMKTLDLTREEAEQLWEDDNSDTMTEEQAILDKKAKENNPRHFGETTKERKKSTRERKVDTEKGEILTAISELLTDMGAECDPMTNEVDLHFIFNNNDYGIKLTKHRQKKGG